MPTASPTFPKNLELAAWRAAAKKDDAGAIPEIEAALNAVDAAYDRIRWDELDPARAKDINDFDENFDQSFEKSTAPLRKNLDALLKQLDRNARELKTFEFADDCRDAAESLQEALDDHKKRADSELQKLLDEESGDDEDDGDDDEDEAVYNLRKLLRMAKKRPHKFVIGRVTPTSDYPLKVQIYVSRQNLNKSKIAQFWPQFGKPRILVKGLLSFGPDPEDGEKKFLYQSKTPPASSLAKLIKKVLRFYKCASLGKFALCQLTKGQDPDLDADTEEVETGAALADLDDGSDTDDGNDTGEQDTSSDPTAKSAAAETLKKLVPTIQQTLKSGLAADKREELTNLLMLARRQIDDKQEAKATATIKDIIQFLRAPAPAPTGGVKPEPQDTGDMLPKMAALLKKMIEDFKKADITDKRVLSEFTVLARRADQNIKDKKQDLAAGTLRDLDRLLKAASTTTSQPPPAPPMSSPPPAPTPPRPAPSTGAPQPGRKLSPFIKFNAVRLDTWSAAQNKAKSQINAFKNAVIEAAQGEADISEIKDNINSLMDEIADYGDKVTDALDKLAGDWGKAKAAGDTLTPDEAAKLEAAHAANRKEAGRILDEYQTALNRHEITGQLDNNPFGNFEITSTIQDAVKKLKDALL